MNEKIISKIMFGTFLLGFLILASDSVNADCSKYDNKRKDCELLKTECVWKPTPIKGACRGSGGCSVIENQIDCLAEECFWSGPHGKGNCVERQASKQK